MRTLIPRLLICLGLIFLVLPTTAQNLSDAALEAAINAANEAVPSLGRPARWTFEILLPTNDSALGCPLVPGVNTSLSKTPYIVDLVYVTNGVETVYAVHAAGDGSSAQRCDDKFGGVGMGGAAFLPAPSAPDACFASPSGPFANVRSAPAVDAVQLAEITLERPVLGRNPDFTWWLVAEGWVANTVVTTRGDCLSNNVSVRSSSIATGLEGALVTTDGATPAPGVAPTLVPPTIDTTCPEGFVGYLPPRIQTGAVTAQVEQGGLPNTLREGPSTETARVGTIQPGRRIDFVLGGPQCSNGFVWWQVEVDGVQGWTAESSAQDNAYFLAPTPGNEVGPTATVGPTPVPAQDISLGGLIDGTITGLVQRDASLFGMTPVLSAVAGGYAWSDGANLESRLSASTLAGVPRVEWTLEPGQTFTSITNRSNSGETNLIVNDDVLAGTSSGDLIVVERLDQSYTVQVHDAPIMAIELNQSAEILATAAGTSESTTGIPASAPETWRVRIWDEAIIGPDTMDDALMRSIRFPYPPTHVAFSADDQYLVVVAQQTTPEPAAALWIYAETGLGDNTYTIALPDPGNAFVVAAPEGVPGDFVYARGGDLFALSAIDGQERLLQSLGPYTTIRGAAASFTGLLAVATDAGLTLIDMTVSPATTVISIPGSYTDVVFTDDSLSLAARRADGTWMAFER